MKGVNSDVIAEVRSRANLLDVISEFVVLKRAGKEHKGLCPFHAEKTPSFHVNPEKGIYKCFGCGEGGDAFAFIQKIKGLDFLDSVRELAHRYGVTLIESPQEKEEYDKRTSMLMLYQQAAEYYHRLLNHPEEGANARKYLQERGIEPEIISRFKLGYAPNVWDGLLRYLTETVKASPATLEEAGLVRRKADSNSYYDLFRHRLMIPIFDDQGRVIAFGGRDLGNSDVKYINSPESAIYTKGQHLFALNLAKTAIKEKDSVIVVEGYFDAITCHQFGFENTVATLGTALTEKQARLLVRFTESKRVYLAFDSDSAGERALSAGVETLNQIAEGIGIELRALRLSSGKDPDEYLRKENNGALSFATVINSAPLLIDYQLERAIEKIDLTTYMGRINAAKQIVPILATIKNAVFRSEYIRQWALRLGIRDEELMSDVSQHRRMNKQSMPARTSLLPAAPAKKTSLPVGHLEAERQLLALYMISREENEKMQAACSQESFLEPVHQRIKEALEGIGSHFDTVQDLQYKLMDRLGGDSEANRVLVELVYKIEEMRKQNIPIEIMLREGRVRILRERINREKNRLKAQMSAAKTENDENELGSKIIQLKQLEIILLPGVKTEDDIRELKEKIDRVLSDNDHLNKLGIKV